MSNQNGKIYIDTTTNPDTGVSVYDVQTVLGRGTGDVGLLCSDQEWYNNALRRVNKINKWAKYKPLRSSKLGTLTDAERVELNQGLTMTKYTNPADLVSGYESDYAYQPPRGKTTYNEWFRLLDFNGYNHYAEGPVSSFTCPSGEVTENQDLIVRLYLSPSNQMPDGNLIWSDFDPEDDKPISEYYFGVIIRTGTSSTYRVLTMSTMVGIGNPIQELALTLPANLFTLGSSYTVYPILSYDAITSVSSQGPYIAGFYSVPDTEPHTFTIVSIQRVVAYGIPEGGFTATLGVGRVNWSLTGVMQVNTGTTVTGEFLYRIYDGAYDDNTHTIGGVIIESGTFYYGQVPVAPSQATQTITGTIRGTTPQYLTAVISYQGSDCLPVTIEIEDIE